MRKRFIAQAFLQYSSLFFSIEKVDINNSQEEYFVYTFLYSVQFFQLLLLFPFTVGSSTSESRPNATNQIPNKAKNRNVARLSGISVRKSIRYSRYSSFFFFLVIGSINKILFRSFLLSVYTFPYSSTQSNRNIPNHINQTATTNSHPPKRKPTNPTCNIASTKHPKTNYTHTSCSNHRHRTMYINFHTNKCVITFF